MEQEKREFGVEDASYQAAGKLEGISALVDDFYDFMDSLPDAKRIRAMHPADLDESRKKLRYFLSGWLGGPRLYSQNYGSIIIPKAHKHLPIDEPERDAWMLCMEKAIAKQAYSDAFKKYLYEQLLVPAERTRVVCQRHAQERDSRK
jgi:hemoglobin